MKNLTTKQEKVLNLLIKKNKKEKNDLYLKDVMITAGVRWEEAVNIIEELDSMNYIKYTKELNERGQIYHYYSMPLTNNLHNFVYEVTDIDLIEATTDDSRWVIEWENVVDNAIKNIYDRDYNNLIAIRLNQMVGQNADIQTIMKEAIQNAAKNTNHFLKGNYNNNYKAYVTAQTAYNIVSDKFNEYVQNLEREYNKKLMSA